MPGDSIGSVSVDIRGDYSRLQADFAGAQALATKAGAGIASGLTAGMAPAAAAASVILDKYGVAFKNIGTQATAATPPVLNLHGGIQRLTIAQALLEQATAGTVPAIEAQTAAMAHGVSQIQATSGAIRVLEGSQGIRAVERFLVSIPGIGAALQAAFPLIGAIALFEMLTRVIGKVNELSEAEKQLAEVTKQNTTEWERLAGELEHIKIEQLTTQFGQLAGVKLKGFYDEAAAGRDRSELAATAAQIAAAQKQLADTESLYSPNGFVRILQDFNPLITGMRLAEKPTKDQQLAIRGLQDTYDTLTEKLRIYDAQKDLDKDKGAKLGAEQGGQLQAAQIANQEKANTQLASLNRQRAELQIAQDHAAQQMRINGISDAGQRSIAAAQEELRVAQDKATKLSVINQRELAEQIRLIQARANAEKAGKTPVEQEKIQTTATGEIASARSEGAKAALTLLGEVSAKENALTDTTATVNREAANKTALWWDEAFSAIDNAATQTYKHISDAAEASIQANAKVLEIQAAGKGRTDAADIDNQKLRAALTYDQLLSHTRAQQIAFAQSQAAFDTQARDAKIAGLNAELAIAQKIADDDQRNVEVARIQGQIAEQEAKGNNDTLAALIKQIELEQKLNDGYQARATMAQAIADWNEIGLDRVKLQFAQAAVQVPGAIGGAVAGGLFDSGKKGMDVGAQIGAAMKSIGKQLFGELLTAAIEKLIVEMAVHLLGVTLSSSVQAANTAQLVILNALLIKQQAADALKAAGGAVGAGGSVAGAGGGIAASAGGAASSAASGLIGPLIAAAGGIIGGVISGVMSLIGAHQIVTAIHGTTAAVQALHGTVSGTGTPVTSGVPSTPAATTGGASQGGFIGFAASILGLGGAKPVDVNIVAISPAAPLKGLFNLFGFAGGGRPPVGVASIVGERGPEMFIPDSAGQIIPAGKFGGGGLQMPSSNSSVTSQSTSMNNTFHVYGVTNARDLVRQIPELLKSTWPGYSPASR